MAATLARGETEILNAARDPEVSDLALCLAGMGARIRAKEHIGFWCKAWMPFTTRVTI